VGQDNDIGREQGAVSAAQVQQHTVLARHGDHLHVHHARSVASEVRCVQHKSVAPQPAAAAEPAAPAGCSTSRLMGPTTATKLSRAMTEWANTNSSARSNEPEAATIYP